MPRPRLRTLDAFAGCGGFSCGLEAVGAIKSCWAVENSEVASRAFQRNFPESTVFTQDFNSFLSDVLKGKRTNANGQQLPQKGDVQLLCGGPPCQGFSQLNRFRHTERSLLKNSLVSSYLSCCDYYRPQLFLLENVKGFLKGHDGRMLPLTLECLLRMGYQCTFASLQAGNYGLPQSRRRTVKTYDKGIQGVCPCAAGGNCDPLPATQKRTLVPWTLVHRAGKGAAQGKLDKPYARLGWDSCMGTVTTSPSPDKFAVLHPSQNRLLTVREYARVQGFPDNFVFVGSVSDKYMQVGNAVPPPLAAAIGQEIIKSLSFL
ncbi:hypothetical protein HPB49_020497 [Dermacentor silvarum]|uniref:Uncharacterized protein n=1 Tax=Dermacentor silvarum TaxID=543639 RepID=A0ACB8DFR0_DERSI|nr:hypothetical protein HPB49_020497 [Dermacentor silvarum]